MEDAKTILKITFYDLVKDCLLESCIFPPRPYEKTNPEWDLKKETIMIKKKVLVPNRIRRIESGFSFIPHRFLTDSFLDSLSQIEILLYLFLCLVSDRYGLSFYAYDAICSLLKLSVDEYIEARDALIEKDLIAYDGTIFQVLELPEKPVPVDSKSTLVPHSDQRKHRSRIRELIQQSLWEVSDG